MGWPLIGHHRSPACINLASGFAFHQHLHAVGQAGNLAFLTRDNIGQIIHRAAKMRELFF